MHTELQSCHFLQMAGQPFRVTSHGVHEAGSLGATHNHAPSIATCCTPKTRGTGNSKDSAKAKAAASRNADSFGAVGL